jgi:spermidine synthase
MGRFAENRDLAISFRGIRRLETPKSSVQKIDLFEHPKLGKILVLGDEVQHVEKWQSLYHEPLVHVPSAFVPELEHALILGGGSLFAAREVLRYPTVIRCTLVDHDPTVLDAMTRHYAHAAAVVKDPRFSYVQRDAVEFLSKNEANYDLVLNDCFDSLGITVPSEGSAFSLMDRRISSQGVCADVIYRDLLDNSYRVQAYSALRSVNHAFSLITVPEYPGILHLLACWGSDRVSQCLRRPVNACQRGWIADKATQPLLQFYNPEFLSFYLYLPPYLQNL